MGHAEPFDATGSSGTFTPHEPGFTVDGSRNAPASGRYDPNDPVYFNSLRWLIYALISFLPFSPSPDPGGKNSPAHALAGDPDE